MLDPNEHFVTQIAEHQGRLYSYVYSLLGDGNRAADVLQETNLVLWRKREEFRVGSAFVPWAFAIARYQVLAHLRDRSRESTWIDSEVAEALTPSIESASEAFEDRRNALAACMQQLSDEKRELIRARYFDAQSLSELADEKERTVDSLKVMLFRVRKSLADCIQKRMAKGLS
ncbi:MAG: sigma-70 family RNA polymerase sigma factor [Pirellulaceae bacterium]